MLIILAHNVKKNSVKAQLYNYILLIIYIIENVGANVGIFCDPAK